MTKKSATKETAENLVEAIEEPQFSNPISEINELKRKNRELELRLEAKDKELDTIQKKEEGWLIWTESPTYQGTTAGIRFTDGLAFVPRDQIAPRFVVKMPAENIQRAMLTDRKLYPNGVEELGIIQKSTEMLSSQRCVEYLVGEFGYHSQFYTKDQQEELKKRIQDRAQERAMEVDRLEKESSGLTKLIKPMQV